MCCIRQQCFQTALHNALVICNHCSPSYGDGRGIAGIMCEAVTFWVASAGLLMLCKYTPEDFTFIKSRAMTISRFPQCWAFNRALMDEKSLSQLFPVGGGGGSGYKWLVHNISKSGSVFGTCLLGKDPAFIWYNAHCHRALTVKVIRPIALIKEHSSYKGTSLSDLRRLSF